MVEVHSVHMDDENSLHSCANPLCYLVSSSQEQNHGREKHIEVKSG